MDPLTTAFRAPGALCGWTGAAIAAPHAVTLIAAMADDLVDRSDQAGHRQADRGAAVAVVGVDALPLIRQEGDWLIAAEGEWRWTDPDLADIAHSAGHGAAFLEAHRRHGAGLPEHLSGAYAFALLHPENGYGLLAVDRMGQRPLAYHAGRHGLVFASRVTALSRWPSLDLALDQQAIYNYLHFHVIPSPRTIFREVYKLEPGQRLEWHQGKSELAHYWRAPYREETRPSERDQAEELRVRLDSAVRHALDQQDTGAFLSGGLDSSTVAGLLAGQRHAPAFSIGFDAPGYDEMAFARAAAGHFDLDLHAYYVTPQDVAAVIPEIAAAYDEPFGNASAIPLHYCARMARDAGIRVLLAGDGGDEIFGGNARYARQKIFEPYQRLPAWLRQGLLEPVAGRLGNTAPPLRKLASYIHQAGIPMPDRLESYNFLVRTPISGILEPGFRASIDPHEPLAHLRKVYAAAPSDRLLKRMLHLDLKITLADNDLRKVTRMCERNGVQVRFPLLDDHLVAFAAGIPCDRLLRRLELRAFFRRAMADFLPRSTVEKSKHGFGLPFGVWSAEETPLRTVALDSLRGIRARGIVRTDYLDNLVREHRSGHSGYYGVFIWVLVMLEQWLAQHG